MSTPREDFKKTHRDLYSARSAPALVDAPELGFLMVDGVGAPEGEAWSAAVAALYTGAYAVRGALKAAGTVEYPVMPLEGLWWPGDGQRYEESDRERWHWTMMIMQPPQAAADLVRTALAAAARRKPGLPVDALRFTAWREGRCAQALHTGPFADEPATLERLYAHLAAQGLEITGRHHEIYLSDFRRAAPERLRTILRYPVAAR
ncbi:hypothetical protein EDD29_6825 [Actinocorallia herbida]|uniref:GyrI-like small molecule binding domain-containing protein n=1 Tax=Actinocorallia herbida TaxID=58109 RepID=A0A3N1D7P2_9ACTN|nr:GyrI-like domain-containing protein [Actinocorallia herbida]ROO89138.1 hypothetical protein EDD29_6825 [Actinocorallia herbida]